MTQNEKLRVEADRRRAVFFQSASDVSRQIRPVDLLDEALGALDPKFAVLRRFESLVKRNPLAMLAAAGGLWLVMRQMKNSKPQTKSATSRSIRQYRLSRATLKGE